jgi:hypothetical protein
VKLTKQALILALLILLLACPVQAFEKRGDDKLVIDTPMHDDLILSGEEVIVNAPVKSIIWSGGSLEVNAPVETNIIAIGEHITVNGPVGTDILAAGYSVSVTGNVTGKVLAAGNTVMMNGQAENLVAAGNSVLLGKEAEIRRDARIGASRFEVLGTVERELMTRGWKGTVEPETETSPFLDLLKAGFRELANCIIIGMGLLGLVLLRLAPEPMQNASERLLQYPISSGGRGILFLCAAGLGIVLLLISFIGIPLGILLILLYAGVILLSGLVAAEGIGRAIFRRVGRPGRYLPFILGYLILFFLTQIPTLGLIFPVIAIIAGSGAIIGAGYSCLRRDPCTS